jgi:hypothetical protein
MKTILFKLLGRASDLIDVQPVLALFLGGALIAVFITAAFQTARSRRREEADSGKTPDSKSSLIWLLYRQLNQLLWAVGLVAILLGSLSLLRAYLHHTVASFQHSHGRITQANYNAVQTIWGAEQNQGELQMDLFWQEEVTERIESEDLTKPTVTRRKTVRHDITSSPFISATHDISLRQNPRKKGSALYGGYETACRFHWQLKNPTDRDLNCVLKFPLPAAGAMYDDLTATLNGRDILPQIQLKDGALLLTRDVKANEPVDLTIAFKSRGMSFWYLQVKEAREIRDFTLTLNLPDLPKSRLNYPEGCMTPTTIKPTTDNQGSILTYRLDHAISNKGMGVALPALPQPGAETSAVLAEVERGWLLIFAMLALGLTLAESKHAVLFSILFAAATACSFGLLADCSDLLFGFWPTAGLVLLPMLVFLAWLLTKLTPRPFSNLLASQLLLFGIGYPALAGLDSDRQTLYFNLSALVFLAIAAWQLSRRLDGSTKQTRSEDAQPSLAQSAPSGESLASLA